MWTKCIVAALFLVGTVSCFQQPRIVNGTDSDIRKYPFMVSLQYFPGKHSCGSSIIAPRWILTAAHCVDGAKPSEITIQYGMSEINAAGPNFVGVKRIIMHKGYAPANSYANDVALLELQGQLVYNYKTIAPVTLPELDFEIDQLPEGAPGVLIGWGRNDTDGQVQKVLQEVNLKIYSDAECNERHNGVITTHQICGGVDEGGKGQCSGDSGGPLLLNHTIQLGIVSWSIKPCTVYPYPGVYTKVSHYVDWIYENIN